MDCEILLFLNIKLMPPLEHTCARAHTLPYHILSGTNLHRQPSVVTQSARARIRAQVAASVYVM